MSPRPARLRVEVPSAPRPELLRAAIEARVAGRPFPSQPEDEVAARIAAMVRDQLSTPPRGNTA